MLALEKHVSEKWCLIVHQTVVKFASANKNRGTGSKARQRHTTGRSNKSAISQLVSTLHYGQMVVTNPSDSELCALCR